VRPRSRTLGAGGRRGEGRCRPHLPRRCVAIDVPEADKTCGCGHAKTRIGETVSDNTVLSGDACGRRPLRASAHRQRDPGTVTLPDIVTV